MRQYSGPLEALIEKYDLRYDDAFADEVPEPDDYITTAKKILAEVD